MHVCVAEDERESMMPIAFFSEILLTSIFPQLLYQVTQSVRDSSQVSCQNIPFSMVWSLYLNGEIYDVCKHLMYLDL